VMKSAWKSGISVLLRSLVRDAFKTTRSLSRPLEARRQSSVTAALDTGKPKKPGHLRRLRRRPPEAMPRWRPAGTSRSVESENATTLKFEQSGFPDE